MNTTDWRFQTIDSIMVPYRQEATDFFPEDYMVSLYCRLVEQDLLDIIFPGIGIDHLNKFIAFVAKHPFVICFTKRGDDITDTAGFGYLTETDGRDGARKGAFGFGFFREHHATKQARSLSWFMLCWWVQNLKIDILYGMTLKSNRLARNFSYNFGFRGHTDLPGIFYRRGQLEDGTIMWLRREDFDPLYEAWAEENVLQVQAV